VILFNSHSKQSSAGGYWDQDVAPWTKYQIADRI